MALVSGVRSTLNPNAPVYIPAAFRQVEEFSPEWYDLINSSMWFRDYWLTQHQETETLYGCNHNNIVGNDVVDLLPDEIDLGVDEDLLTMESQFEEFLKFSGSQLQESKLLPKEESIILGGAVVRLATLNPICSRAASVSYWNAADGDSVTGVGWRVGTYSRVVLLPNMIHKPFKEGLWDNEAKAMLLETEKANKVTIL
ncbi:hypothetical protein KSS87_006381 [Heliosperma pusillum]|nr:hypothetical protein KSS87_006381 [Heliosperma pusillum]